jgi:GDPmannose 4,6-dehydratase
VADLCLEAFAVVGRDWKDHVVSDVALFREGDPPLRLADPGRARRRLGWSPEVDFRSLVSMMVKHEMADGRRAM